MRTRWRAASLTGDGPEAPASGPPSEVTIYWCRHCGWKSFTNYNAQGLPCVRCLHPEASLHPVKYELALKDASPPPRADDFTEEAG